LSKKLRSQNGVVTYDDIKCLVENAYFHKLITSQFYKYIYKTMLICSVTLVHTAYTSLLAYLLLSNVHTYMNHRDDQANQIQTRMTQTQSNYVLQHVDNLSNPSKNLTNSYGTSESGKLSLEGFEHFYLNHERNQLKLANETICVIKDVGLMCILVNKPFETLSFLKVVNVNRLKL
jgi:hypothetical protein